MGHAEAGAPRGVLLSNLGTPVSPSTDDVRRFLDEFLSDPRVVRAPRWLWLPLLRWVILPRRAPKSAHAYAKIWTDRGSPLLAWSLAQREALARELGPRFHVALGMRYGSPSLADALGDLERAGCGDVLLLPLYPQNSDTTTGTTIDRVRELIEARTPRLAWQAMPSFPTDHGYIDALVARVREALADAPADHTVLSFHGLPERYVARGDPYAKECEATATALANALELPQERWTLAYQSRFGPGRWLGPATRDVLALRAARRERVAVVLPGFAADCLETVEEIGIGLRAEFDALGGRELVVVPALDDHPRWIQALANLVRSQSQTGTRGW